MSKTCQENSGNAARTYRMTHREGSPTTMDNRHRRGVSLSRSDQVTIICVAIGILVMTGLLVAVLF